MRDRTRPLAIVAVMLALTGCLDVRELIDVAPDGSGRIVLEVAVDEAALASAGRGDPEVMLAAFRAAAESARNRAARVDGVLRFDAHDRAEVGRRVFVVELDLDDVTELADAQAALYSDDDDDDDAEPDLRMGRLRNDNLVFLQSFGDCQGLIGSKGEATSLLTRAFAASALADSHVTVILRGPGIVSSNGTVGADRKSVEWRLNAGELVTGEIDPAELRAEVAMRGSPWPWIGLALFAALAIGMGVVYAKRRRDPGSWRA